jgi:hypothetical protein
VGSMCTCGLSLVVVPFLVPLLFILPLFCLWKWREKNIKWHSYIHGNTGGHHFTML